MKSLLLIDANALVHRSFHALPAFTSKTGKPTGALYGLSNILLKILHQDPPDYIVAFFDRPEPTFRKEMYKEYKIHRPKAPDELISQIIEAHNLFEKFNIKTFEKPGFEADDLIGSASHKFKNEKNLKIIILTGDLDTLQLVENDKVVAETLKKGVSETIIYNETAVIEKYGISPKQLPDFKGLVGDPSDNISGVKGIGPKTASALIQEYNSLENFFEKFKKDGSKKSDTYQKIIDSKEIALLSKKLATIDIKTPLEIENLNELKYEKIPLEKVIKYFQEFGFESLIKRISNFNQPQKQTNGRVSKKPQSLFLEHQPVLSQKLADETEAPLAPILKEMEETGIKVDKKRLEEWERDLSEQTNDLTKKIYREAGQIFNINSPKQLLDILKKKFALKIKATNYDKLIAFRSIPIIDLVLKYRELFKLKSTYIEPLTVLSSASRRKDERIHPTFVQLKAATGRITCENPNLQNIPETIRDVFIADNGFKLVSFDYSQIELRILASLTEDKNMIEAFENSIDIHQLTASKIFNVPLESVNNGMRKIAKTLNFGIVYGMGARSFAQESGLSIAEAKKFISEYFKDFPAIKNWQRDIIEKARRDGCVKNLNGRVRYFPEIISSNPRFQSEAERMAVNFPIQSLAADIIKMAMVKIKEKLTGKNWWGDKAKMLLTIHDELVFEISAQSGLPPRTDTPQEYAPRKENNENLKEIIELIKNTMESIYKLKIPLRVNVGIGNNWRELK